MEFIIHINNYKEFVREDKYLVIDTEFIEKNSLETCIKIIIKDIKDKDLLLYVTKVCRLPQKLTIQK